MPELTFMIVVIAMIVLNAAVFVGLVYIGVRLAIRAPMMPRKSLRRLSVRFASLRATVARARHYHGVRP
jgi:hypothetical protein